MLRGTVELECGGASMGGVLDGWRQSRYLHSPDLQREIVNEMSVGRGEKGRQQRSARITPQGGPAFTTPPPPHIISFLYISPPSPTSSSLSATPALRCHDESRRRGPAIHHKRRAGTYREPRDVVQYHRELGVPRAGLCSGQCQWQGVRRFLSTILPS